MRVVRDERTGVWIEGEHRGKRVRLLHPARYLRGWVGDRYVLAPIPGTSDHAALSNAQEVRR